MRRAALAALLLLLAWLMAPPAEYRDGWVIGPDVACHVEHGCVVR